MCPLFAHRRCLEGNLPFLMCPVVSLQDSDLFLLGTDSHKKKKKHSSDEYYHRGEKRFICNIWTVLEHDLLLRQPNY